MDSLKAGQVAEILGIKEWEVRKLFEVGSIKGYKTSGGHRKYFRDSVYEYKDSITPKNPKYTLIYILDKELNEREEKLKEHCEMENWKYEIVVQRSDLSLKQESIKKVIKCIEKEEIERIIFSSFEKEDMPLLECIQEIAKYHEVEIVKISKA